MSSLPCCALHNEAAGARIANGDPRVTSSKQHTDRSFAGMILPSAILVLLPKCPACIAAYVAITGIGLSFTAATYLRLGIVSLCVLAIAYFGVRYARRLHLNHH